MNDSTLAAPAILIGDADQEAAGHLRALLESWHYPVQVLAEGQAVLQRLMHPVPPAIAILDFDLPVLPAIDVVAEFRRRTQKHPVWTVLTSANASPEIIRMASDAGVDDFLLKPINELDLRVRLRTGERVQSIYSDLYTQMEAVRFHASHDRLTSLLNRKALLSKLFQETDRVQRMKTPLAMLLLDLDGFSQVNLDYGYAAGDRILKELAQRFKRYLRSYDMVGRCGEDEFLMGLPGCTPEEAITMAERLQRSVLQKPFQLQHDIVSITASIGLAQSNGRSPLVVLREAECALADAKLSGRNCVRAFGQRPAALGKTPNCAALPSNPLGPAYRQLEAITGH